MADVTRSPDLNVELLKKDFPILDQQVNGHRLVYLDSAASSQKPTAVLAAMQEYYETTHANVHRGVYAMAEEATARYEASRGKVRRFINGRRDCEIVYTKNVILGAVGFATLLGTINATAIAFGRVVPFIATLAMFSVGKGLALLLNDKQPVGLLELNGGSFGDPAPFSLLWFGTGEILGIPVSVYIFLGITIGGWIVLNRSRYGRHVVAVGGNREAARIAGVPVRRVIFSVYVLSGLLVGIATVLLCARLGSASPVSGNLYELDAIGAVVIGGTSLMGGRATIVGTFLGVLTFALIFSLMTQLNLSTEVQQVTKGAIVLGAVLLQRPEARY